MPWRGLLSIFVCSTLGVLLGAVVGFCLGKFAPAFCIAILQLPESARNPESALQMGIGLGIANGIWVGLIAGIALVIAESIKSLKDSQG